MPDPGPHPSAGSPPATPPAAGRVVLSRPAGVALALGTVYLVWGSTYLGIRVAIETVPPLLMAGVRFTLAGALMVAFARWRLRASWPTPRQWRDAAVVGGALLLCGNGGVVLAERHISSGLTATLVATVPMFLLLFGWAAGHSPRPSALTLSALAVGFAGVCLLVRPVAPAPVVDVSGGAPPSAADLYAGSALVLFAAAVWAAGSLYAKRADKPASAVLNIGTQMLLGGLLLGAASGLRGEWWHFDLTAVSARSGWALLYLISVGSLVGFSAYIWVLGAASPTLAGTYAFVNPAVAVLLGWGLGGEAVNTTTLLGMGIILAAVTLVVLFPAHQRGR